MTFPTKLCAVKAILIFYLFIHFQPKEEKPKLNEDGLDEEEAEAEENLKEIMKNYRDRAQERRQKGDVSTVDNVQITVVVRCRIHSAAILHYWWHKAGKNDFGTVSWYAAGVAWLLGIRLWWAVRGRHR